MILSDRDILQGLKDGRIKVIPDLDLESQLGSCSIDFRLGNTFMVFEHSRFSYIDPRHAQSIADHLSTVSLVIPMKVGEEGRLFGSVTSMQIEKALKAKGLDVDRRKIHLNEAIKTAGDHEVPVRLSADLTVPLKLSVVSDS